MKAKKLIRIATPATLSQLMTVLGTIDVDEHPDAVVSHRNGELMVEEPQPTLEDE